MGDSKEKVRSGIITWLQGWWSERSGAFKCSSPALFCIIIVLVLRLRHAGGDVWGVVYQFFDTVLLTLFAAFTVSFAWEVLGKNALLRELQDHTDKAFQDAGLSNTLANQGILHTTTDFQHGIPWNKYIADADEIDVCWWAGSAWLRGNADAIKEAIQTRQVRMRYAIPNPYDKNTLFLMGALSGVTNKELESEYDKATQELHSLGKPAELYNVKKIPQYGMVRLGRCIVFFPYSHLKDRPKSRPTFVIDANSELGKCFLRDFDDLIKSDETLHPLNF